MLAEGLAEKLKSYRALQRPTQQYVFEGKTPGEPIAPKTIQGAIIIARRKAGLPEWAIPSVLRFTHLKVSQTFILRNRSLKHVLRHSFATASLQNGADLLTLKELLGHKKLSTTSRYMHLNIKHYQNTYNPTENSCLAVHLKKLENPDTPSDKSSASLVQPTSKSTNPTTVLELS